MVLDRWPDVTASRIYTTFGDYTRRRGGGAATPGGYLRQLLEANADAGDIVKRPPRTTLYEDLKLLRGEPAKNPSD